MLAAQRSLMRIVALAVLLAGLLTVPARPVSACSCVMPSGPDVAFSQAEAVFSGTVTAIANRGGLSLVDQVRRLLGLAPQSLGGDARLVTLTVAASWKGVTHSPVIIGTGAGDADCGYAFTRGSQYLVYAYDNQVRLATNICTRTAEVSQAPTDLAYLQAQPTLPVTNAAPGRSTLWLGGAVCGLTTLLLAGVGAWAWRRRAASPR